MNWGVIILLVLRFVNWVQNQGLIKQGYDQAIAETAREIFRKSEYAKRVKEKIDAMSDAEVDAALVSLEPSSDVPAQPANSR